MKTLKERIIQPERIKRVVVRGANWVGDAVMTVPALRELRRVLPAAHLTLETRVWAAGIFEDADFIDEILPLEAGARGLPAFLRQAREWRRRRFDAAVIFPNAFAPALVAAAARVPVRIGYRTDGRGALLTHPLAVPRWRSARHEVFYYLNIVDEFARLLQGATETADEASEREPRLDLTVSEVRRERARRLLGEAGADAGRPLVALCPGSTNSRAKRWPAARFAALADLLIDEAGAEVLLIGAREERDVSDEVVAQMRARPVVLTGQTTLAETAALLSVADLLVTNDTGPAHLAAATGCPTIVIFGPTNPLTTRPFSSLATVIREPPDCAPCMLRDCPIDHRCMTAITAEAVFERARALIRSGAGVEIVR